MRYLKSFNERQIGGAKNFKELRDRGFKDPMSNDILVRDQIKKKIEEIFYILNDVDIEAYAGNGSNCVVITLERKYDDGPTGIETAYTDKSYGSIRRKWIRSLSKNEAYLEFVDRVEEICQEFKYRIYAESTLDFTDKSTDKCYILNKLIIVNDPVNKFAKPHDEIEVAIEYEANRKEPGIINKSITWVGKKLNLI